MTSLFKKTQRSSWRKISTVQGILLAATMLYIPSVQAAPVYKVTDAQTGQIIFTDNPQKYEQQAGKQISELTIHSTPAIGATNTSAPQSQKGTANAEATATPSAKAPQIRYQLTLLEPSAERAYRRPAQSIDVNVQIKPALQTGNIATIYLDNTQVGQGLSASIPTLDILPGAHTLKVVISDEKGRALQQVTRTVYVIQNTQTLQNNKKIAQQLLAYQNLPWHQKVLLKLRQDNVNQNPANNTQVKKQ